jgi:hypothetical protein
MNPERQHFLSLRHLPARLSVEEAAYYLGFSPHEIPKLTKAKLLKPLGNPGVSATKLYARSELRDLSENAAWLAKASDAVYSYWQERNAKKERKRRKR